MTRSPTARVLGDVVAERLRQEALAKAGRFPSTAANPALDPAYAFAILSEEVGEVARAIVEAESMAALRTELVQVAAVAVAMIEGIDAR